MDFPQSAINISNDTKLRNTITTQKNLRVEFRKTAHMSFHGNADGDNSPLNN